MTKLLNASEVQGILGVGKDWLNARVKNNEIPHLKLGHYLRFDPRDIQDYIAGLKQGSLKNESVKIRKLRSRIPKEDLWQK
jgi:predicted DNA-binding transcriptional regulator AlpA